MFWGRFGALVSILFALGLTACNSGRDKLLADLQSTRPDERALAVKKLAEQNKPEDLTLFTQAARDPVAIVRGEAMLALGKSQDARVVDLLGEGLTDPNDDVQAKAARALAAIKNEKARAYLTLQFGRRGRPTRQVIVQALKEANVPGAMANVVAAEAKTLWDRNLKALTDGTLPEKVGAAEELGKSGKPEAVNKLVALVKDPQVVLAAASVRGLASAGDKRAAPAIVALLKENYPELREAACEALSELGDDSAVPALAEVALEKSPSSPLAARALAKLPASEAANKALCEVILLGGPVEAATAGRELRKRQGCPLEPVLEKLKNPTSVPGALQALAALGPSAKDAAAKVAPLLAHSDPQVRKLAADALAELKDGSVAPALQKAWDAELKSLELLRAKWVPMALPNKFAPGFDPDAPMRPDDPEAAQKLKQVDLMRKVRALAEARAREQNRVLRDPLPPKEVVDDANEEQLKVMASLLRAIGKLDVPGAKEIALRYVDESSVSLRAAAFVALAALGPEGLKAATPGLTDENREVQSATAQAFAEAGETGQAVLLETMEKVSGDRSRLVEPLRNARLTKAAVGPLLALVKEGGADAGTAALILGELGATEAVDPLLKYLDDPTSIARREVLQALGRLKDQKALPSISRELYHENADVRAAAAEAMAHLGAGGEADALDALKGDYYRKVRDAASATLKSLEARP